MSALVFSSHTTTGFRIMRGLNVYGLHHLRQALQFLQWVWCGEVSRGIFLLLLSLSPLLIR